MVALLLLLEVLGAVLVDDDAYICNRWAHVRVCVCLHDRPTGVALVQGALFPLVQGALFSPHIVVVWYPFYAFDGQMCCDVTLCANL